MSKFLQWLEKAKLKKTKHRLLVLKILDKRNDFLSADDIFMEAKKSDPNISLSTVYRILDSFTEKGIVSPINIEHSKQIYYEISHTEHAHHLICLKCNKVIHLTSCPIEDYETNVSKTHNFKIKSHTLDFYGYCEACQKNE